MIQKVFSAFHRFDIQYKIILGIVLFLSVIYLVFGVYRLVLGEYEKAAIISVSIGVNAIVTVLLIKQWLNSGRWLFIVSISFLLCLIPARYPLEQTFWIFPGILSLSFALRGKLEAFLVLTIVVMTSAYLMTDGELNNVFVTFVGAQVSQAILCSIVVIMLQYHVDKTRMELNTAKELSELDALTGISNRRTFDILFTKSFETARGSELPAILILIDIDHFKSVNDQYGHAAGDLVLKRIARVLEYSLRSDEFLARFGGEEFVVILELVSLEKARYLAERLRLAVEGTPIELDDGPIISCTVSIGLATSDVASPDEWFNTCDTALYHAKSTGRNRVC